MNARVRRLILEHARVLGCTCDPEIAVERIGKGALQLVIAHEEHCALVAEAEGVKRT